MRVLVEMMLLWTSNGRIGVGEEGGGGIAEMGVQIFGGDCAGGCMNK